MNPYLRPFETGDPALKTTDGVSNKFILESGVP